MTTPTPYLPIPEITPLQERAIRRFEHDRDFHIRCYTTAHALEATVHDAATDLAARLRDAMTALQEADEALVSDEAIVRGARCLGLNIVGLPYDLATEAEQEGLKAGVRQILAAVKAA